MGLAAGHIAPLLEKLFADFNPTFLHKKMEDIRQHTWTNLIFYVNDIVSNRKKNLRILTRIAYHKIFLLQDQVVYLQRWIQTKLYIF